MAMRQAGLSSSLLLGGASLTADLSSLSRAARGTFHAQAAPTWVSCVELQIKETRKRERRENKAAKHTCDTWWQYQYHRLLGHCALRCTARWDASFSMAVRSALTDKKARFLSLATAHRFCPKHTAHSFTKKRSPHRCTSHCITQKLS